MNEFNITKRSSFAKISHFAQCWVKDRMHLDEINDLMKEALNDIQKWLKANPDVAPEDIITGCGKLVVEIKKKKISTTAILRYAEKHHLPMPEIRKMVRSLERCFPKLTWKIE